MSGRVRIYSRRDELGNPVHQIAMLYPFFGAEGQEPNSLNFGQFDAYCARADELFEMVAQIEDADVAVLSISWRATFGDARAAQFAQEEIARAERAGKRIVIFFDHDLDAPVAWPAHAIVFRFSLYADTRAPNEFAPPQWSQDFMAKHADGSLPLRKKRAKPSVGFCGYAPPLGCAWGRQRVKDEVRFRLYRAGFFRGRRHLIAHALRANAICSLQRSPRVTANVILRGGFAFNQWGVLQPGGTPESAERQRREFVENLIQSDYVLCSRGLANCSIRFYEALSLGRIPVFVNTQCVLPFERQVNWRDVCVWIEEDEVPRIGEKIAEFHDRLSDAQFEALQRRCRQLFEEWIRPEGFFKHLSLHWREGAT